MDYEKKFKEETGFNAFEDNNLRPKVPSDYYVEWLEEQLTIPAVIRRSELLVDFSDKVVWKDHRVHIHTKVIEDYLKSTNSL